MNYSKETLKLISLCWSGDEPRNTNVIIGTTYCDLEGNKYKITEDTYKELVHYQSESSKIYRIIRNGNFLWLQGMGA